MTWQSQIVELLTASLIRPVALAAAAWLILRLYKVKHPASRHAVWTAVLIGMMVLPLVTLFAPQWKLPLLPKKPESAARTQVRDDFAVEPSDVRVTSVASAPSHAAKFAWPEPQSLIVWCYLAGLFAMAIFRLIGWALLWRVMSKSRMMRARLRESSEVVTPVTVGVLRPTVILPTGWRDWNPNTKRAVLAHEFAHIRRRDTLTSSLSRVAKCIYWFHPLAWWISRQMSELAELSCDAAVLEKNGDPGGYSRILLGFAETVNAAGYRAALPGLAIASCSGMGHRIDQVFELASGDLRRLSRPGTVLALMGLPVMCIAAVVGLSAPATRVAHQDAQPVVVAQLQQPAAAPLKPAQEQPTKAEPAPKLKFEVASIRTCTASVGSGGRGGAGGGGRLTASSGRLFAECQTLATLIRYAYLGYLYGETESHRLVLFQEFKGIPAWGNSDRYTIEATGTGTETKEMLLGPMLRTLLEDRFSLQIHRETREVPVYNLVVAKGGPKLQPAREGSCVPRDPNAPLVMPGPGVAHICGATYKSPTGDGLYMYGTTMARLCVQFSAYMDLDVVDKTGLTEAFDVHLDMSPEDLSVSLANHTDSQTSAIFSAMTNLGLKLESAKGPGEFIVIDQAERPSEN